VEAVAVLLLILAALLLAGFAGYGAYRMARAGR
jgi:hypothetical protein